MLYRQRPNPQQPTQQLALALTSLSRCHGVFFQKLYQHRPPIANTNFFHQCREQCHVCKKLKAAFLDAFSGCHCCVRCHGHPAMERPLPQSWSSPSSSPTIALHNGTLQWHPAMAPCPLPQSWSSPFCPAIAHYSPPPTIAHYNGTQQWHHVHSPKVGRHPPPQP